MPRAPAWARAARAWRSASCGWRRAAAVKASATLIFALSWGSSLARRSGSPASMVSAAAASPRSAASQPR